MKIDGLRKTTPAAREMPASGAQSIDRAATLLRLVGRAGPTGARLSDLVAATELAKPTARRLLVALLRAGLLDQDADTRRYHLGPELYALGTRASARFGVDPVSTRALVRLAEQTGDTAFLSIGHDLYAICLRRVEGRYPIRVHALQVGDTHPLGVGAGSLALLAALPDREIDAVLAANADALAADYPGYSVATLRRLVAETRAQDYALNPGMLLADSWGIGRAIRRPDGRPAGALSIAAIESRLTLDRQRDLAALLRREVGWVETRLTAQTTVSPGFRSRPD